MANRTADDSSEDPNTSNIAHQCGRRQALQTATSIAAIRVIRIFLSPRLRMRAAVIQSLFPKTHARAQLLVPRAVAYSTQLSLDLNNMIGWSEHGLSVSAALMNNRPRPAAPSPLPFTGSPTAHFDEVRRRIIDAPLPEFSASVPPDDAVPTSSWSAARAEISRRVLDFSSAVAEFEDAAGLIDTWQENHDSLNVVSDHLGLIEENYLRLTECPVNQDPVCIAVRVLLPELQIAFQQAMGAAWSTTGALRQRAEEMAHLAGRKRDQIEQLIAVRAAKLRSAALLLKNRLLIEAAALSGEREALRQREEALRQRRATYDANQGRLDRLLVEKDALIGDIQESEYLRQQQKAAVDNAERQLQEQQIVYQDMLYRTQNYKAIFLRDRVCPGGRPYDDCRTPAVGCTEPEKKPAFDRLVAEWRASLARSHSEVDKLSKTLGGDGGLRTQLRSTTAELTRYRNRLRGVEREIARFSRELDAAQIELNRDEAKYVEDRNRTAANVYGTANENDLREISRVEAVLTRSAK